MRNFLLFPKQLPKRQKDPLEKTYTHTKEPTFQEKSTAMLQKTTRLKIPKVFSSKEEVLHKGKKILAQEPHKTALALHFICFLILFLLGDIACAYADINNAGIFDNVLEKYYTATRSWASMFEKAASFLFWSLATISMVWTFSMMALRKADLGEFFAEFFRFIVFTGFFWWILINGPKFAISIYDSLKQLASMASLQEQGLSPSGITDIGFAIFLKAIAHSSLWSMTDSLITITMGGIIMVLLSMVGVNMLLMLISGWILAYAGIFFLGFGGSRWTSHIAIQYYKTVLSIATQLMTTVLLAGIGKTFLEEYFTAMSEGVTLKEMGVMLIIVIILFNVAHRVPHLLASIIGGGGGSSSNFDPIAAAAPALAGGFLGAMAPQMIAQSASMGTSIATSSASMAGQAAFSVAKEGGKEIIDMAQTMAQHASSGVSAVSSALMGGGSSSSSGGYASASSQEKSNLRNDVMDVLCATPFGQASGYCNTFWGSAAQEVMEMTSAAAGLSFSVVSGVASQAGKGFVQGVGSKIGNAAEGASQAMGEEIGKVSQGVHSMFNSSPPSGEESQASQTPLAKNTQTSQMPQMPNDNQESLSSQGIGRNSTMPATPEDVY